MPAIARRFADRIHFAHLRNVAKEPDGSFMEADHLGGDTDMVAVIVALLEEQKRRQDPPAGRIGASRCGRTTATNSSTTSGRRSRLSAIGRLKGLAELRGVMTAVAAMKGLPV